MIQSALDSEPSGEKQLERDEEKGHLFRASSLSELAEKAGIDAAALEETVARYNSFFRGGLGARPPITIAITGNNVPFTGGTYYALVTNSVILATVGGLTINGDTQVLDTEGRVIEGLYATGNVSGNFYAGNYPRHIPGTSVGRRRRSVMWR